jgi:hypothetical protein
MMKPHSGIGVSILAISVLLNMSLALIFFRSLLEVTNLESWLEVCNDAVCARLQDVDNRVVVEHASISSELSHGIWLILSGDHERTILDFNELSSWGSGREFDKLSGIGVVHFGCVDHTRKGGREQRGER